MVTRENGGGGVTFSWQIFSWTLREIFDFESMFFTYILFHFTLNDRNRMTSNLVAHTNEHFYTWHDIRGNIINLSMNS